MVRPQGANGELMMMQQIRNTWKELVERELTLYATEVFGTAEAVQGAPSLTVQKPPKPELGDVAFPLFAYAKSFRLAPNKLAEILRERLSAKSDLPVGELLVAGPYLNVRVDISALAMEVHQSVNREGDSYGCGDMLAGKKIMVEFSCPNTNKPLHLGHLRNDAIGESISAILKANGAEVLKVNLINNRGVHICKSMLAYQKFGNGETPESAGIKGDHLVGKYYVKFAQWEKEDPSVTALAQDMLKKWEEGDPEVLSLWSLMNGWTLDGVAETYKNTGISFDKYYYESDTYMLGKDTVMQGVQKGVFYKEDDGSVWIDLAEINLDKKVLLRKDGTSLYLTQDIGTAISRHGDWPFDSLIYVVASEQTYHFKVLFHVLEKLGYPWASDLHHLAYGMVNLPEGKMKSREGTVVDADDLFEQLTLLAMSEIKEKEREDAVGDVRATSEAIALGALNYFLLQVNPMKDMVFNPSESISFSGNTGPYLQYMGARISSMIRKFSEVAKDYEDIAFDGSLLSLQEERELVKLIAGFGEVVQEAGRDLNPSAIAAYLYELSRLFSKYYHDHPVLKAPSAPLVRARVSLVSMVLQVLRNAYALVGIPFLESM
jgi:arginyl-tRNA synthetase